jgi:hypothetical protein
MSLPTTKIHTSPPPANTRLNALLIGGGMFVIAASIAAILIARARANGPAPAPSASDSQTAATVTAPPGPSTASAPPVASSAPAPPTSAQAPGCTCRDPQGNILCFDAARIPVHCRCETKKKVVLCPQPWTNGACVVEPKTWPGYYFRADAVGAACTGFRRGTPGKLQGTIVGCTPCGPNSATYEDNPGAVCEGFTDTGMARGTIDCKR